MIADHPDVVEGSSGKYQNWELVDPEKWVPDGYVCVRVDSEGPDARPAISIRYQNAKPATFTSGSSGPQCSRGATDYIA